MYSILPDLLVNLLLVVSMPITYAWMACSLTLFLTSEWPHVKWSMSDRLLTIRNELHPVYPFALTVFFLCMVDGHDLAKSLGYLAALGPWFLTNGDDRWTRRRARLTGRVRRTAAGYRLDDESA